VEFVKEVVTLLELGNVVGSEVVCSGDVVIHPHNDKPIRNTLHMVMIFFIGILNFQNIICNNRQ
jgi:hypothetical protein